MSIEKARVCLRGFGPENRIRKFNVSSAEELAAQALNRRAKTGINVCKLPAAAS